MNHAKPKTSFVASDGTTFETRDAWRKYEFALKYTIKNGKNQKFVRLPGEIQGQPFDLCDSDGCEILLLDHCSQVQVDNLTNCHVFIGPSCESIFLRNCCDCKFTLACKQLRTRDCHKLELYLYSMTDPIIETSSGVKVAPFNGAFPSLPKCFAAAGLDPSNNHWKNIFDFNDEGKTGKNWSIIDEDQRDKTWKITLETGDSRSSTECINPVSSAAVATTPSEIGDSLHSFSIHTSAEEAMSLIEQRNQAFSTSAAAQATQQLAQCIDGCHCQLSNSTKLHELTCGCSTAQTALESGVFISGTQTTSSDANRSPVSCTSSSSVSVPDTQVGCRLGIEAPANVEVGLPPPLTQTSSQFAPIPPKPLVTLAKNLQDKCAKKDSEADLKNEDASKALKTPCHGVTASTSIPLKKDKTLSSFVSKPPNNVLAASAIMHQPVSKSNAKPATFLASDGKVFDNRDSWRKYEFALRYTFKDSRNAILKREPGEIEGQPFDIYDLDECEVLLLDHMDQVQVDNVKRSRIFIGPSSESVFIRNCSDCVFTVACKQLRTRDCHNLEIYLYSQTDPVIETSNNLRFAPFNGAYPELDEHFRKARLDPNNNHWKEVFDFNDEEKRGNHWSIIDEPLRKPTWTLPLTSKTGETLGSCINPVSPMAVSTTTLEQMEGSKNASPLGMQAFSLKTSQVDAQRQINMLITKHCPFDEPNGKHTGLRGVEPA